MLTGPNLSNGSTDVESSTVCRIGWRISFTKHLISIILVHYGFYSAYHNTSLHPNVVEAVQEAQELRGDLSIMVTGHSMGGAMAAFCAINLVVNFGAKNVEVVTFGQPRMGNSVFASYYSNLVPKTIRVTNEHDIMPHLPPYYTFFPQRTYHHFPQEAV